MSDIDDLTEAYLAMAREATLERQAQEWSDGLIGDSFAADPGTTSQGPEP